MCNKAQTLAEDWGYLTPFDLMDDYVIDSVSPAICMNPGCDYSTEYEPDQNAGWCEACDTNSVQSMFVIEGMI